MVGEIRSREVLELTALRQALRDRIEALGKKYNLKPLAFALIFKTTEQNVRNWLKGKALPPGPVVALMEVLEQSEEARQLLGVYRYRSKAQQRRAIKPRPAHKRQASRELAEKNELIRGNDAYFDVELFLEGPVNWPTQKPEAPDCSKAADHPECDD
jgi:DNA-binding transcriptional regulator YiaG